MAPYRILSFDGGGIRGLLSAVLVERLEARVPGWITEVDLFAGTSTGGIIALGLAMGLGPTDLRNLYYDRAPALFKDSWLDDLMDLGRTIGAEYGTASIRDEMVRVFGDARLGDLPKRTLVTSFDLDNEDPDPGRRHWKPKFFHNFPGPDSDADARVVDVALYTTAAPTYFPSVDGYIDGSVVANNPSMAALAQALDRRSGEGIPALADIRLLSVGAGTSLTRIEGDVHDWGYAQWAKPIITLMLEGLTSAADFQCEQILGDRYHRINHTFIPGEGVPLDSHARRDYLVEFPERHMLDDLEEAEAWIRRVWV